MTSTRVVRDHADRFAAPVHDQRQIAGARAGVIVIPAVQRRRGALVSRYDERGKIGLRLPIVAEGVDMARTGANRGWGGSRSERVDPVANPDYKEVFDCGVPLDADDPLAGLPVYAANLWPASPAGFQAIVEDYFGRTRDVAMTVLEGIARSLGRDPEAFAGKFARPMALLRGNYYPPRPAWAGERDFGIAAHTDYGCLTLLASDGQAGLELETRDGHWREIHSEPGEFVVNFGEMLEIWSAGAVKATPHRVVGGDRARLSIALFFNPDYDADVSPPGSVRPISAGAHLSQRYAETYLHLNDA